MGKEIERKFTVNEAKWLPISTGTLLMQGYLSASEQSTVRIRTQGDLGFITIKGKTTGFSRDEYEYEIPLADAIEMLTLCSDLIIKKYRYKEKHNEMLWEIDVFLDKNEGLIVAEIELESEDQEIILPEWITQEVTNDKRYYNALLAKTPYSAWK